MKTLTKILVTAAIVLLAVGILAWRYWDYVVNPWTRDGQVRAQVVQVAPQVSGAIVRLAIEDNRFVAAGDLLSHKRPAGGRAAGSGRVIGHDAGVAARQGAAVRPCSTTLSATVWTPVASRVSWPDTPRFMTTSSR